MLTTSVFAFTKTTFQCGNDYQQVKLGDTLEFVEKSCGKPQNQQESKQAKVQKRFVTEWYMGSRGMGATIIYFVDDKVFAIQNAQNQLIEEYGCFNSDKVQIKKGDHKTKVFNTCGKPGKVQTILRAVPEGEETIQTLTYSGGDFYPSVTLRFVEGKLTEIK